MELDSKVYRVFNLNPQARWIMDHRKDPEAPLFSIEIEVENVDTATRLALQREYSELFEFKEDGSLRDGGFEVVNRVPLEFSWYQKNIANMLGILQAGNSQMSHRCSIHIHNNVLFKSLGQLYYYIAAYYLVEPELYEFAGRSRVYSNFCVPLQAKKDLVFSTDRLMGWDKYTGLSFFRLKDLGTAEWRHFPGSFDDIKFLKWMEMISRLDIYTSNKIHVASDITKNLFLDKTLLKDIVKSSFIYIKPESFDDGFMQLCADWEKHRAIKESEVNYFSAEVASSYYSAPIAFSLESSNFTVSVGAQYNEEE